MPIQMVNVVPGMPPAAYEEAIAQITEPLRQTPGFVSHAAQVSAAGVTVTEVWQTREQWQAWFDQAVKPHMPPGAPAPGVVELDNVIAR